MSMGVRKEEEHQEKEDILLLQLYDVYWFKNHILTNQPAIEEQSLNYKDAPSLLPIKTSLTDPISSSEAQSPSSVLAVSTFDYEVFYDNEDQVKKSKEENKKIKKRRVRRCCEISKSLSELEFEEIRGFMDLGFKFSEADQRSPRLVSILPGLQQLGGNGGKNLEASERSRVVARPYLSEVWKVKKNPPLLMMMMKKKKCKLPSLSDEDDMKNLLKKWVRAVASTVRLRESGRK